MSLANNEMADGFEIPSTKIKSIVQKKRNPRLTHKNGQLGSVIRTWKFQSIVDPNLGSVEYQSF